MDVELELDEMGFLLFHTASLVAPDSQTVGVHLAGDGSGVTGLDIQGDVRLDNSY